MTDQERARAQLLRYIAPNEPKTQEDIASFEEACAEQAAYLAQREAPEGVTKLSLGEYAVETDGRMRICETAKAILYNAHLKRFSLPQAERR